MPNQQHNHADISRIFLCAATALGVLYYRRYKKDQRENLEDAQWNKRQDWEGEFNERQNGNPGNSHFPRDNRSSYELSTLNAWDDKPGRRN